MEVVCQETISDDSDNIDDIENIDVVELDSDHSFLLEPTNKNSVKAESKNFQTPKKSLRKATDKNQINFKPLNTRVAKENPSDPLLFIPPTRMGQGLKFKVQEVSDISEVKFQFYGFRKSGKRIFKCLLCGRVVKCKSEHAQAHIPEKKFKCHFEGCEKSYRKKQGLLHHLEKHSSNFSERYKCDKCGKSYCSARVLASHKATICYNEHRYSCKICKKVVKSIEALKRHEAIHTNVKPVSCEICHKMFSSKKVLAAHYSCHYSVTCFCGKSFDSWSKCKAHKKQEHLSLTNMDSSDPLISYEQAENECVICRVSFQSKTLLDKHNKLIHSKTEILCPICEKEFKTKQEVKEHLQFCDKQFKCSSCRKQFFSFISLEKHRQNCGNEKKNEEPSFQCLYCPQSFLNAMLVKNHMLENHVKSKNNSQNFNNITECFGSKIDETLTFQCEHCSLSFKTSKSAKEHMLESHGNLKSETENKHSFKKSTIPGAIYNCELCSAVFQREASLVNHEIKKHCTLKDKYRCSVCNVLFITTRTLWKHEYYEHKLGDIYFCDQCEREFFTEEDLNFHKTLVHNTD